MVKSLQLRSHFLQRHWSLKQGELSKHWQLLGNGEIASEAAHPSFIIVGKCMRTTKHIARNL